MNIQQIIDRNKNAGYMFFDDEVMAEFNSKVITGVIKDKYFVTFEQPNPLEPGYYALHEALPNGRVATRGTFLKDSTLAEITEVINVMEEKRYAV